jgi:hypothetical protein
MSDKSATLNRLRRGARFFGAAAALGLLTSAPRAQGGVPLVIGQDVERSIAPGETHRYRTTLAAGDFVLVRIVKRNVEIVATLSGPDGGETLTVQSDPDPFEPEFVAATSDVDGTFMLDVRTPKPAVAGGRYVISLDESRPARGDDRVRIEAERAVSRANLAQALRRSPEEFVNGLKD